MRYHLYRLRCLLPLLWQRYSTGSRRWHCGVIPLSSCWVIATVCADIRFGRLREFAEVDHAAQRV